MPTLARIDDLRLQHAQMDRTHEEFVELLGAAEHAWQRGARDEANWEPLGVLLRELAQWFPHHVAMMDAGLAMHLEAVGFPF
jgi:hemerythrin